MAGKTVTFYRAYGYSTGESWRVPLRLWVHKDPDVIRRLAARGARRILRRRAGLGRLDAEQKRIFIDRARDFVADSESFERGEFVFDDDREGERFQLTGDDGATRTDFNGLIEGELILPAEFVDRLMDAARSQNGWLSIRAVSDHHEGRGWLRLIAPRGHSVISDIDDTIKDTRIHAGEETVLRNTFFRSFAAVGEMAQMYAGFDADTAVHYVSGGPWQMYRCLSDFMFSDAVGFPPGSFHMKNVRTNPFESESYQDFWKLIAKGSKTVTLNQKVAQIAEILQHFPERSFDLIGDSGEKDPEVFRDVANRFPTQVKRIVIRDVIGDHVRNPSRLADMDVVPAHFA